METISFQQQWQPNFSGNNFQIWLLELWKIAPAVWIVLSSSHLLVQLHMVEHLSYRLPLVS